MKHRVLGHLLVITLLLVLGGCSDQASPLDLYLQGQLAAEQGRLPQAMAALSAAIRENPHLGVAYIARANILQQQGDYEGAQKDYQETLKTEPYNFTANFQLGVIYQHLKKYVEATEAFKRALETRPLDPAANMNLALVSSQSGEAMQAIYYAQVAVKADPNSAPLHANLGVLYAQSQFHAAAIEQFKLAIEIDSHVPEVYLNLGQEYYSTAAFDQARNVLETARGLAPSTRVSERLGATCYRLKDYDRAEAAYRDALKLDTNDIPSLNGLGATLMSKALLSSTRDVAGARAAVGFWNQSLALDKNQPAIQNLVNQYTPRE